MSFIYIVFFQKFLPNEIQIYPHGNKDKLDEKEIEELNDCIAKYRSSHRVYIKLIAVKYVKTGKTRTEVSEILHVNRRTVGNWVKSYEEEGIAGLIPKYENCGLKFRLSNEQLLKLQ